MKLLEGKNILITGASRGIGRAIALSCASHGANIGFTYLSDVEKVASLAAELADLGVKAKGFESDAADFAAAQILIKNFQAAFNSLDALVNNAGITKDGLLMRMSEQQFDEVIRVNLKSVFNLSKAACPTLIRQKKGTIISMSSVVGIRGHAGQANYAASKAGIIGFTKSLALELGSRNITANAIAPGFIETEMTSAIGKKVIEEWKTAIPLKRVGTVQEVADLVVFLASDMSNYITGQVIEINGGMNT